MHERIIEIEADSLEEARKALHTDDVIVFQESILCREKVGTIEDVADTLKEAFTKAINRIPAGARIEAKKTIVAPKRMVLQVEGRNEERVRKKIGPRKTEIIESISLHKKGRKRFLRFFKAPNIYEVTVYQRAVVEVKFRVKARIHAKVQISLAEDLLQSVQGLRRKEPKCIDKMQFLNPKNDPEIRECLIKLSELNLSSALDIIENVCHENAKATWKWALQEAHRRASIAQVVQVRELRERKVSLRKLDVEIAETFAFYVSIIWDSRSYKQPTGIPRYTTEYDHHRPADKSLRETIPRYSTDKKAFGEVERMVNVYNLHELYLQLLFEGGHNVASATLEQKCGAILRARKLQIGPAGA